MKPNDLQHKGNHMYSRNLGTTDVKESCRKPTTPILLQTDSIKDNFFPIFCPYILSMLATSCGLKSTVAAPDTRVSPIIHRPEDRAIFQCYTT